MSIFINGQQQLKQPELEAEIYYLTEQEGGRKAAVGNGYRGQFYYNGNDWDAPQQFLDKETCLPGETVKVYLQTLSPDFHVGQFFVGQEFEIREGARTVGKGKITSILRTDFNYWDGTTFLKSLDKNIEPYTDKNDLKGYCIDFEAGLTDTGIIDNVEFEMTGNLECMILVKCKLIHKKTPKRTVAHQVIECWKTTLATSNQLYKVQTTTSTFVLTFAAWHSIFLTGQIVVAYE